MSPNTPAGSTETASAPNSGGNSRGKVNRKIDEAFESASRLAGSNLSPTEFYEQFLAIALAAIDAPAGVIWLRTPQGFLQIQSQLNLDKVGLDEKRGGKQCHNEILRQVFQANPPRPLIIEPQGRLSGVSAEPGAVPAANLTDHYALFAPIVQPDKTPMGLLEVFHDPAQDPRLYQTFLHYAVQMAGYASQYHAFSNSRQTSGLERLFTQLETFSTQIHGTLNPTEVAYHVANEGRRIVECDRLCVGVRHGKTVTVEAVSGADVVEKASTHIRRMKNLMDAVQTFGDKLVYRGTKDDGLPPALSHALDAYLAESQPKLLVVMPIRDEREKDNNKLSRSILLMESFNPPEPMEPVIARLDVVAKHSAPALYNAAELKRIPFRFIWTPISKIQETFGGKRRFYTALGLVALGGLIGAMTLVPYPMKLAATGEFLPKQTINIYPPAEGIVKDLFVRPGDMVKPGAQLVGLRSDELAKQFNQATAEATSADNDLLNYDRMIASQGRGTSEEIQIRTQRGKAESLALAARMKLANMKQQYNLDALAGAFLITAPRIDAGVPGDWQVLSDDKRSELMNRTVRQNEALMRLGAIDGEWRVELKLPQRILGHVARAFEDKTLHQYDEKRRERYLPVDVLLGSQTDRSYPGRLYYSDLGGEAVPNRDNHNEQEPIMLAYVRVNLEEFPDDQKIPRELRVAGVEARTRIRCGSHALGYSLFHGVWEWFYEKVIFIF